MKILSIVMACFAVLGALDLIFGNKLKIGKEFEKGVKIIAPATLSMAGMLILAPLFGELLVPLFAKLPNAFPFEPSTIAGSLLANDMGGAPLAMQLCKSERAGYFNGLVLGSMTGATVSFALPYAVSAVDKKRHPLLFTGILCGLITVPFGALVSALMLRLSFVEICVNLAPSVLLTALLGIGIVKAPTLCTKLFSAFGIFLKALITAGLALGIFTFLTGWEIVPHLLPFEEAMQTIIHIGAVMAGAFPLVFLLSKLLQKPLKGLSQKAGICETAALGFVSALATSVTVFESMKDMDDKGVVLNAAFSVSAAFVFADHLAFTLSLAPAYLPAVIVGKLVAGFFALLVATLVWNKQKRKNAEA